MKKDRKPFGFRSFLPCVRRVIVFRCGRVCSAVSAEHKIQREQERYARQAGRPGHTERKRAERKRNACHHTSGVHGQEGTQSHQHAAGRALHRLFRANRHLYHHKKDEDSL